MNLPENRVKRVELAHLKRNKYLAENAILRYLVFAALYISEGIPIGITFFAIPAWLAMNNIPAVEIATYTAVIIIPWTFKLVVAPIMDRYTLLSMGRKRPWILMGQIGLFISVFSMGFTNDPLNNLQILTVFGFIISFFGVMQDIAIDGMAVEIIPKEQQARANGIMWGSRIIGQSLALVIGTALINTVGFTNAVTSLSFLVILLLLVPLYFREHRGEKMLPWTKGKASSVTKSTHVANWKELIGNLKKCTLLSASLLLCLGIFLFGTIAGMVDVLLPIFTVQQLEWTNTAYSQVYSASTITAGFIGIFIGGFVIDLLGTKRMILYLLTALFISFIVFILLSGSWQNNTVVFGFVIIYYLLYTLATIATLALGMKLCWQKVSASQFTIYMTLNNLGVSFGAWLLGKLTLNYDWPVIITCIAIFPLLSFFIFRSIKLEEHLGQIAGLSRKKALREETVLD
ncbi:muropeptide MFS transporter AmpG [Pontixanthobacter gangjinensis]|uniref:AmpG family muropeptide MFS transporter n=1 Tax=Christiangramia aestuarii TaxID=1028746 RepID=A0A7M4C1M5_9FLAO|nr:MFS transporter [Christiangramia aestuarii]MUP40965.1 AmpG family muropeptide MFS transporter [Christiangramia aestuarii]